MLQELCHPKYVGGFPMIDHSHMMMDKLMAIDLEEDGEMEEEPLGRCSDG